MRRSIAAVGDALAASAGTVICGLSLMGFAEFAKVRCAGPAIALALVVALLASLTLTPALLQLLGRAVFWPAGTGCRVLGAGAIRTGASRSRDHGPGNGTACGSRISRGVVARPGADLVRGGAAPAAAGRARPARHARTTSRPANCRRPSPSIRGLEAIQKHFTAGETGPLTVLLDGVGRLGHAGGPAPDRPRQCRALAKLDNVAEVRSLTQPLGKPLACRTGSPRQRGMLGGLSAGRPARDIGKPPGAGRPGRARALPGGRVVRLRGTHHVTRLDVILASDPFDPASMATLEQIETWLRDELPRCPAPMGWVEAECYGVTVHSRDLAEVTEQRSLRVNVLVLAGIFVILLVLVRRVWLAAYLLLTVLFSYYATLGATALAARSGPAIRSTRWTGACRSSCSRSWWRSARTTTSCW